MILGMAKAAATIGGVLIILGVALGFVGSADCGSVFRGPDWDQRATDRMDAALMGEQYESPDCSSRTDLTVPVWLLIAAGGVLLAGGLGRLAWQSGQRTADSQDASPSGNETP